MDIGIAISGESWLDGRAIIDTFVSLCESFCTVGQFRYRSPGIR